MDECVSWTPPATFELTGRDGRLIRYCSYGPRDGSSCCVAQRLAGYALEAAGGY